MQRPINLAMGGAGMRSSRIASRSSRPLRVRPRSAVGIGSYHETVLARGVPNRSASKVCSRSVTRSSLLIEGRVHDANGRDPIVDPLATLGQEEARDTGGGRHGRTEVPEVMEVVERVERAVRGAQNDDENRDTDGAPDLSGRLVDGAAHGVAVRLKPGYGGRPEYGERESDSQPEQHGRRQPAGEVLRVQAHA